MLHITFLFHLSNFPKLIAELHKSVISCTRSKLRFFYPDFFNVSNAYLLKYVHMNFWTHCTVHADTMNKKLASLSMNSVLWYAMSWHSRNSVISVRRARCCLLFLYEGCFESIKLAIQHSECCQLQAYSCFTHSHKYLVTI